MEYGIEKKCFFKKIYNFKKSAFFTYFTILGSPFPKLLFKTLFFLHSIFHTIFLYNKIFHIIHLL